MTDSYGIVMLATGWVGLVQGVQMLMLHVAEFAGLLLVAATVIAAARALPALRD